MYWTKGGSGDGDTRGVYKAEMDGTNVVKIVSSLDCPFGIAIDFASQRLFWTDFNENKVHSSNLDGTDVQLVVQLSSGTKPLGIAVTEDRLFWGNYGSKSLQSCEKTGQDIKTLRNGTGAINHLTVATPNPVQTRPNHCEGQACPSGMCVLSKDLLRCVTRP